MRGDAAVARGQVLRAWREAMGLSGVAFAARTHLSNAALSRLENGNRGKVLLSPAQIRLMGADLALGEAQTEAFLNLWRGAASPLGLNPRAGWVHNFRREGFPCWVWLRPADRSKPVRVVLRWGAPFTAELFIQAGDQLIITFPTNTANPPLTVHFDTAGWADFGVGQIPPEVAHRLRGKLVDGVRVLTDRAYDVEGDTTATTPRVTQPDVLKQPAERAHEPLLVRLSEASHRLGIGWSLVQPHLHVLNPHANSSRDAAAQPESENGSSHADFKLPPATRLFVSPEQIVALRETRGLTKPLTARLISRLERERPATAGMVARLESDGTLPRLPGFLNRLDQVLRADGVLGMEVVSGPTGSFERMGRHRVYAVRFPSYWIGPVWLRFEAAVAGERFMSVQLTWDEWRLRRGVDAGSYVTFRRSRVAQGPLRVHVPDGWTVTAGTGRVDWAQDWNEGWRPLSVHAARALLAQAIRLAEGRP